MNPESRQPNTSGARQQQATTRPKRSRVLLSCGPCRFSKLKCDREAPCGQCQKKGREDLCEYAPKPEKKRKPARTMAARLQRLEGMVRNMMDSEVNVTQQQTPPTVGVEGGGTAESQSATQIEVGGTSNHLTGQVIRGENASTSYVGATHCIAMLEDVSLSFALRAYSAIHQWSDLTHGKLD